MGLNPPPMSYCNKCGNVISRAIGARFGKTIKIEPKFCRVCGNRLTPPEDVDEKDNEVDFEEIDDTPFFDDLADFTTLEGAIKDAVPDNYKELPVEELRRQIVGALWKRYTGIYPYRTPEQQAAMDREHEEMMQQCIATGTPPSTILNAPGKIRDERAKKLVRQYHAVWINGLTTHTSLTPEELEMMRPQLERDYYKIKPCDCASVKYVPDENHPRFMRKAESGR
jgi:hypothetical protein